MYNGTEMTIAQAKIFKITIESREHRKLSKTLIMSASLLDVGKKKTNFDSVNAKTSQPARNFGWPLSRDYLKPKKRRLLNDYLLLATTLGTRFRKSYKKNTTWHSSTARSQIRTKKKTIRQVEDSPVTHVPLAYQTPFICRFGTTQFRNQSFTLYYKSLTYRSSHFKKGFQKSLLSVQ